MSAQPDFPQMHQVQSAPAIRSSRFCWISDLPELTEQMLVLALPPAIKSASCPTQMGVDLGMRSQQRDATASATPIGVLLAHRHRDLSTWTNETCHLMLQSLDLRLSKPETQL